MERILTESPPPRQPVRLPCFFVRWPSSGPAAVRQRKPHGQQRKVGREHPRSKGKKGKCTVTVSTKFPRSLWLKPSQCRTQSGKHRPLARKRAVPAVTQKPSVPAAARPPILSAPETTPAPFSLKLSFRDAALTDGVKSE